MSTPGADPRVRLAWPGQAGPTSAFEEEPPQPPRAQADSEALQPDTDSIRPLASADDAGLGAPALRRAIVDAYDRLADRVLERMRSMHDDVDADLAEIRSEVSTLRQAVDDLGERVQLRALRSAVDELRSDVVGMRRALLEWPELERVSGDITSLRADMTEVVSSISGLLETDALANADDDTRGRAAALIAPLTAGLAQVREDVGALDRSVRKLSSDRERGAETLAAALAPVLEELAHLRTEVAASRADAGDVGPQLSELRDELKSLRRRISLRAGS